MKYDFTNNDLLISKQRVIDIKVKIDVYDGNMGYLSTVECGVISASVSVDAESDVRRTATLELIPQEKIGTLVDESGLIWLNRNIKLYIGIVQQRTNEIVWYPQGVYVIMSADSSYDASTNTLSLSLSDWMAKLDGSRNGTLTYLTYSYPAYQTYFSSLWCEYASVYASVSSESDVYNWCLGFDDYTTKITQGSQTVKDAAWNLIKNYKTLSSSQIESYLNTIRNYIYPNGTTTQKNNIQLEVSSTLAMDTRYTVASIVEHNKIRDAMVNAVSQLGYISDYNIDYLGERKGMPFYSKNVDYLQYRQTNPYWDDIPSDQEFEGETTVLDVITALRDLYEDYEAYFDIYNTFCCNMIPDGTEEVCLLENEYIQTILISEDLSLDFTEVKNVEVVWGQALEPDFYCDITSNYSGNVYYVTNTAYVDEYCNGDQVAIKVATTNQLNPYININNLGNVPIYDENYEVGLRAGVLKAGHTYVFKIKKTYNTSTKENEMKAYYEGEYQIYAMDILTDGTVGEDYTDTTWNETCKRYSKRFFELVYNCDNVHMTTIADSPFTIQKLGIIPEYYQNDDITSQSTAVETARQENWRNNRLTDNITIVTKLIPWIDVNIKINYKPSNSKMAKEYIIKNVSHDLEGGTTSLQLMAYYNTYIETEE